MVFCFRLLSPFSCSEGAEKVWHGRLARAPPLSVEKELPTGDTVELSYDKVGRRVSEVRMGEPSYVIWRGYRLDGQLEQEYVETLWEGRSSVVWRVYDYDDFGRLRGAYDVVGGPNWVFEWACDRLVGVRMTGVMCGSLCMMRRRVFSRCG